jgi:dTDP-4-amino-4,6-dideoxygalactose transaminase
VSALPPVPLADPARLAPDEADAVAAAVAAVLRGPAWVGGEPVAAFERALAAYVGAPDGHEVVGVGNGTDALAVAFGALGLRAGDGVLVADDEGGYASTAAAQLGLRVRVMDVDPHLGVPTATEAARAADTAAGLRALVVTHLHGDAVPLDGPDGLDAWRRERGLLLVEDCAQAHGLRLGGRHVGLAGDAATFSFYPTKNLGAVGDGGAVLLPAEAAARARVLREYGWGDRYRVEHAGGRNSRLDTLQAAVLSARLPFLDARNARRREIANAYRAQVAMHGDPVTTVAHHAVALAPDPADRDVLRERLAGAGIMTAVHYPWLVSEMPGLEVGGGPSPAAGDRRHRMLSLPCFPEMTQAEIDRVVGALA